MHVKIVSEDKMRYAKAHIIVIIATKSKNFQKRKEVNQLKTAILSMSLNGELSVTLHSTRYLQDVYKDTDTFDEIVIAKSGALPEGALEKFKDADLVMFTTSMYHFFIASQAMDTMVKIGEYMQANCPGKPVTYFMTSNFLMDVLVHDYFKIWARNYGMKLIKGLSFFSDDVTEAKYRADLFAWFNNVKAVMAAGDIKVKRTMKTKIVLTDTNPDTKILSDEYESAFIKVGAEVTKIDMTKYDFKHCLGCQYCYTTRQCCIEDEFDKLASAIEEDTDAVVYIGTLSRGFYSTVFKRFMDRHVCMGRCPLNDDFITLFAYSTAEDYKPGDENLFKMWATAYTSFGGEILIDVLKGYSLDAVNAVVAAFNENIAPYRDFYWGALNTRFAELARVIRNIEPLDYECFDAAGMYEVPPANQMCRAITSMEGAKKAVEMKTMPVRIFRTQGGDMNVPIPERRTDRRSLIERAKAPAYAKKKAEAEAKPEKKGFKLFGGKK